MNFDPRPSHIPDPKPDPRPSQTREASVKIAASRCFNAPLIKKKGFFFSKATLSPRKMGLSLGDLYITGLLFLNAIAVLHEQRFLAKSK